ncbi:MAG: DUF3021 domain-containing protein [Candidatus Spyradocola sp.]|jgi:hypothetical protein
MLKKVFCYLERGLAIGFLVTTFCMWNLEGPNETMRQVLVWMIASVCYGAISLLFEVDALPLPAATAIHLLLCTGVTVTAAYVLGYADSFRTMLGVLPSFLVIYAGIYGVIFLCIWISARRMNRKLGAR